MKQSKDIFYVGIQIVLFGLFIFIPEFQLSFVKNASFLGLFIMVFGGIVCAVSILQLNKNLSPFPSPKANSNLITTGLYSIIRHPIYLGILLLLGGYALFRFDLYKIIVVIALYILFHFKSSYEERLLEAKFSDYKNYKKKTGKIFPRIIGLWNIDKE